MQYLILAMLLFCPKSWEKRYIQRIWDKRSDKEILESYEDAEGWISLTKGRFPLKGETIEEIANSCQERLDKRILPQMEKRGLKV